MQGGHIPAFDKCSVITQLQVDPSEHLIHLKCVWEQPSGFGKRTSEDRKVRDEFVWKRAPNARHPVELCKGQPHCSVISRTTRW